MELFVRRCNLDIYSRDFEPIKSTVDPARRALVNLLAFEVFHQHDQETRILKPNEAAQARSLSQAQFAVTDVSRISPAAAAIQADENSITENERLEVAELARRMWVQFLVRKPVPFIT